MVRERKGLHKIIVFISLCLLVVSFLDLEICSFAWAEQRISRGATDVLSKTGEAIAEIVDEVKPTIVNISSSKTIKTQARTDPFFDDPFFRRFFGDESPFRAPKERKAFGLGSGVIVDSKGLILTSNHVIQGADEIKVTLLDKRELKGEVIGTDPLTDVAVIRINAEHLAAIKWGDSDKLRVGETVLAIGSPYGLTGTVTMGIVSAVGRANVGIANYEDFIQTDAAINPGNSGGALVNVRGELVGINAAIFSTSGGYQGIGFAVPSNMAKAVMDSLIKRGKVVRGWLGVTIQPLTPELAKQFNLKEENGALIGDVVEGGPAERAGILRGDVIIDYEGKKIDDPNQLRNMVANTEPGKEVQLTIIRENKTERKRVTIGELPTEMEKTSRGEYNNLLRGISVKDITPELMAQLNLPKRLKGVVVTDIGEDSPAVMALTPGDVIQEVNRQKVTNVKEYETLAAKLKSDENILLLIYRNGSSIFITLSGK